MYGKSDCYHLCISYSVTASQSLFIFFVRFSTLFTPVTDDFPNITTQKNDSSEEYTDSTKIEGFVERSKYVTE